MNIWHKLYEVGMCSEVSTPTTDDKNIYGYIKVHAINKPSAHIFSVNLKNVS